MLDKDSDVSRIVDRLYDKQLISRKENPDDRRLKTIEITKLGLDLLDRLFDCEKKADTLLNKLSKSEIILFNQLLDKIRTSDL